MANEYAAVFDLMDRLSIPISDPREGQLLNILTAASRWVDQQTGHRFYQVTETRYYNPERRPQLYWAGTMALDLLERPWGAPGRIEIDDFTAVTQVATDEDGDGTYEVVWTEGSDYWLGPRNAPANGKPYRYLNRNAAIGRYLFPLWEESISVTGVCGWCDLADRPADIGEVTLMAATLLARPVTDLVQPGVQSYTIPQTLQVTLDANMLPEQGQRILNYYRGESVL